MLIGIDFDNTIVNYNRVFHKVAREQGLISGNVPISKGNIRDYLRVIGQEEEWTKLQGVIYGTRMNEAEPFNHVFGFFHRCNLHKIPVCIISHKTRYPYRGPRYDLHQAAWRWMERQGFFDPQALGLDRDRIFLELTQAEKIRRIIDTGCTHFIDDLPELLSDDTFPQNVTGILFDPDNHYESEYPFPRASSWNEISECFVFTGDHE